MKTLENFARFILNEFIEEYITESIKNARDLKIPILKLFDHLSEDEWRAMTKVSSIKFLESLITGTALDDARESLKQWEKGTLPGVSTNAIGPSDLVLVYASAKYTLYKFLPLYTQNANELLKIVKKLEEYYTIVQNDAVVLLFELRKKAEIELNKKNEQLEEAQAIAHIGSWEYDARTHKIIWSDEMYRIYGYEPGEVELTEEFFHSHLNSIDPDKQRDLWQKALESRQPFYWEYSITDTNGQTRILETKGKMVFDEKDNFIKAIGTIQDVTSIRHAEIEREISKQKDEFMGIASHELKTPLTSVKAYVELMAEVIEENKSDFPQLSKYIVKAKDNIVKLHSLIADLLDVSKIQAGKLQLNLTVFSFEDLLNDCLQTIRYMAPSYDIKVEGNAAINLKADKHRIEQVVMNYLTNAVKYSPKNHKVKVVVQSDNHNMIFSVTDYGIGIPEDKIGRLFTRFYRVNDDTHAFSGLGIGLYIASEIIQRHKGKVWVESKLNEGSTFYFSLPLAD